MKPIPKLFSPAFCILALAFAVSGAHDAFASRVPYFPDITVESPSKKFKIEAVSPDNAVAESRFGPSWQASFVYTFRNTEKNEVLWTRKQPMETRKHLPGPPGHGKTYTIPAEESPVSIFVSDAGWTVIQTDRDELIVVDIAGKDRGVLGLLKDGLTEKEKEEYVVRSTGGPRWKGCSLWYFLDTGEQPLFVVTPWWGRRIVLDLKSGRQIPETPDIAKQAVLCEKNFVLAELQRDASALDWPRSREYKRDEHRAASREYRRFMTAAYVAGRNKITEAIPMLEELQYSSLAGISSIGHLRKNFSGEVDPRAYSTFPLRQVAHLSLRRLGKTPEQLPATQLRVRYGNVQSYPYVAKETDVPRAANAGKIKSGMTPEEVLDLIGEPDYVGLEDDGTWGYNMDAEIPFTLLVHWGDERRAVRVEQKTPALWQNGLTHDRELMGFSWGW